MTHLLEDALVEELLQLLVAVVDAELLKAVVLKVFWRTIEEIKELRRVQPPSRTLPTVILVNVILTYFGTFLV